ncbi:MAG: FprA family A-type flavoprotein [Clostridia bacterium]|nr:FprA family A-type flavoprotein [Clostridia bacterium]
MEEITMTDNIRYIGVNDHDIDLFEGQYIVPNGMAYNSYLILDENIAVMDTVDIRKADAYFANLEAALEGRTPDYLIVSHVEPDHASSVKRFTEKYPTAKVVGNAKTIQFLANYFDLSGTEFVTVKDGDSLSLGQHQLHFILAPMVHWPEVMMTYESTEKVLFSADAFGKFGALDVDEDWDCEARRYYFNIVGKFGVQVQSVLKKAAALEISTICPLHGPILTDTIPHVLDLYNTWSSYGVESEGVFIAYASIYGNTRNAATQLKELLEARGCPKVAITDLAREDMAEALEDAFRYGKVVLAASSYNGGVMPFMEDFLHHLKAKNYQKRTIGLIENGTWAPSAAKTMKEVLAAFKDIAIIEPAVTIRGALKPTDLPALEQLADELMK